MLNQRHIPPLPQKKAHNRQFMQSNSQLVNSTHKSYIQQLSLSQVKEGTASFRKSSLIIENEANTKSHGNIHFIPSPKGLHFSQTNQNRSFKNNFQSQLLAINEKLQELSSIVNTHELKLSSLGSHIEPPQSQYYTKTLTQYNGREGVNKILFQNEKITKKTGGLNLEFQLQSIKKEMHQFISKSSSIKNDLINSQIDKIIRQKINNNEILISKIVGIAQNSIVSKIQSLKMQLADTIGKNNNILSNFIWKFQQNISNLQEEIRNGQNQCKILEKNLNEISDKNKHTQVKPINQYSIVRTANNKFMGTATILKFIEKFQLFGKQNIYGQIPINELTYKVDSDGYLLDSEGYYLVTEIGNRIQLEQRHMEKLGTLIQKNYTMR